MENQALTPAETPVSTNEQFELGTWLGRHQAFGWIASKCSAADAHTLREIYQRKLYRSIGLTWEEFLDRHAGVSRKTADHIIERLEEFGDSYFNLCQILHISTSEYRALAPAVENDTVEFENERIPITRENTERLARALHAIRLQLQKSEEIRAQEKDRLTPLWRRLDGCIGELAGNLRRELSEADRAIVKSILENASARLAELQGNL